MLPKSIDIKVLSRYILSMKFVFAKIFVIFFIVTAVYAGAFLEYFHGRSEGEDIRLEWKTGEESNLQNFIIERKTPQSSFAEIITIQPKGNNSFYSYLDKSAYKPTSAMIFVYRLKIVDNNNQVSYSAEITVSHNVSGVKRTWGSIKAMFR
jgi:dolichyl-phosphate-mannose--protein O-mannosyl transferase